MAGVHTKRGRRCDHAPSAAEVVWLTEKVLGEWCSFRRFESDLMVADISAQGKPPEVVRAHTRPSFFVRHACEYLVDVDMLVHNVLLMPGLHGRAFRLCHPPPSMVVVIFQHPDAYRARAIAITRAAKDT